MPDGWKPCKRVLLRCPTCGNSFTRTAAFIANKMRAKKYRGHPLTCSIVCGALQREKRKKLGAAALVIALFFAVPAHAKLFHFTFRAPCWNADAPSTDPPSQTPACYDTVGATPLTDLARIVVYGRRCGESDWSPIDSIQVPGRECSDVDFDMDITFPPDTLGSTADLRLLAVDTSGNRSCLSPGGFTVAVPRLDSYPGLWAAYYDNMDFTGFAFTRVDPNVDFEWGQGSPDPRLGADEFSVTWDGKIEVPYSGTWTFCEWVEDGGELRIGSATLFSDLTPAGQHETCGSLFMQAGVSYPFRLRYIARFGHAGIVLSWSHAQQPRQVVPASAMRQP